MNRRWFNLFACISLLLAILVLVDRCIHHWYESFYVCRAFRRVEGRPITHHYILQTGDGVLIFCFTAVGLDASKTWVPEPSFEWSHSQAGPFRVLRPNFWGRLGFGTLVAEFQSDLGGVSRLGARTNYPQSSHRPKLVPLRRISVPPRGVGVEVT